MSCFSGLPKPATILILPGNGWRAIGSFMVCCSILNWLDCPSTPATPSGAAQHLAGFAVFGVISMDPPPATCQGCATALRARFAKVSLNVWQIVQVWNFNSTHFNFRGPKLGGPRKQGDQCHGSCLGTSLQPPQ